MLLVLLAQTPCVALPCICSHTVSSICSWYLDIYPHGSIAPVILLWYLACREQKAEAQASLLESVTVYPCNWGAWQVPHLQISIFCTQCHKACLRQQNLPTLQLHCCDDARILNCSADCLWRCMIELHQHDKVLAAMSLIFTLALACCMPFCCHCTP